jgi:hypothetical protein
MKIFSDEVDLICFQKAGQESGLLFQGLAVLLDNFPPNVLLDSAVAGILVAGYGFDLTRVGSILGKKDV